MCAFSLLFEVFNLTNTVSTTGASARRAEAGLRFDFRVGPAPISVNLMPKTDTRCAPGVAHALLRAVSALVPTRCTRPSVEKSLDAARTSACATVPHPSLS